MIQNFPILICFLALPTAVFGQKAAGRASLFLDAGARQQRINGKIYDGTVLNNNAITVFRIAVGVSKPINSQLAIEPSIAFLKTGSRSAMNEVHVKMRALQVLLPVRFHADWHRGFFETGAGPYVGKAFKGRVQYNGFDEKIDFDARYQMFALETQFKAWDAGAIVFAGYGLNKHFSLRIAAQPGFRRINRRSGDSPDKSRWTNFGWGLTLHCKL